MKIFLSQPKRSDGLDQLKMALAGKSSDIYLFPEGYLRGHQAITETKAIMAGGTSTLVTSYLAGSNGRDMGLCLGPGGCDLIHREKSGVEGPLLQPSQAQVGGRTLGYLLCREIFLDYDHLMGCDIIFNPIGVGMFSEDQFKEWTSRASEIAKDLKAYVFGVSHADGSYRNCGFSIPIGFGLDPEGGFIYLSHTDTRSVVIDLDDHQVTYLEGVDYV